jgi:hypothetical protein
MTSPSGIPDLTRPDFFDGQRLDATDLSSIYDFHRELRWLHNRALHDWGIASGLGVSGAKGGREVTISPGYAIDCLGHDLVLSERTTLVVPAIGGAPTGGPVQLYLTASWLDDDAIDASETRDGVCADGGAVRRPERPRLRFQNPRDPRAGDDRFRRGVDIVLASVLIEDCKLAAAPSLAERRDAHPATQPYVFAGTTPAGATDWRVFPASGAPEGVETIVDTAAAGVTRAPAYSANVVGPRALSGVGPVIDGFASVVAPTATSFTLRVTLPRNLVTATHAMNPDAIFVAGTLAQLRDQLRWSVSWMGIEG